MKKIFILVALCAQVALLTQCMKSLPKDGYEIKVTVGGNPVRAYLHYIRNNEEVVDSVDVVNNQFVFTGIAALPFGARMHLNYDPETFFSPRRGFRDSKNFYVESGTIIMTSPDSIKHVTITGSAVNADSEKWDEQTKVINRALNANNHWYAMLPEEERYREENHNKAFETFNDLTGQKRTLAEEFVINDPDSWYAFTQIYKDVVPRDDADAAQNFLNMFSNRLRESDLGKEKQAYIDVVKTVAIGALAPEFTQNDPDGNPVKVSDFRGKWVLIDFWASWCGPCRADNPLIVKAFNQYKEKGFTVLGVSLDFSNGREAWLKAIEDDKLTWTQVSDLQGWDNEAAKLYAVRGVPSSFLINPEGIIVAKGLRGKELMDALEKNLH